MINSILFILISFAVHSPAVHAGGDSSEKAFHLLNRFAYGPRPGEVEALAAQGPEGLEKWFNAQMNPSTLPDPTVEQKLQRMPELNYSIAQLHLKFPKPKADPMAEARPRDMLVSISTQRLIRAVESSRQLQEVLLDFWFNHFNVDFQKGQVKWYLIPYERDAIRPHLFGKFRELLGAVAKHPAMLIYLDNAQSVREGFVRGKFLQGVDGVPKKLGLNENYGRELLELHTLGVDGHYTQNDVREAARALTGWSVMQPQRATAFQFHPRAHDEEAKHILDLVIPAGGGLEDGEKLLDMLAKNPATAHFIARKLCVKFIADKPPASAVEKLASAFLKTDGDLKAVYRELFHLPEFWSAESRRAKIKTPFEFEMSAIRALGGEIIDEERGPQRLLQSLNQMGQPLYRCQPPTGYKATAENWVNPGALVTRINFGLALSADRMPEVNIDVNTIRERLAAAHAQDLKTSVSALNQSMLAGQMRDETRDLIVSELSSEQKVTAEHAASVGAAEPAVAVHLTKLLGLILGSPEFQRR